MRSTLIFEWKTLPITQTRERYVCGLSQIVFVPDEWPGESILDANIMRSRDSTMIAVEWPMERDKLGEECERMLACVLL